MPGRCRSLIGGSREIDLAKESNRAGVVPRRFLASAAVARRTWWLRNGCAGILGGRHSGGIAAAGRRVSSTWGKPLPWPSHSTREKNRCLGYAKRPPTTVVTVGSLDAAI